MFDCLPLAVTTLKMICLPSGDHPGSRQDADRGSEDAAPHDKGIASWWSPLPSASTCQIASRWSVALRALNRIRLPLGDQLPPNAQSTSMPAGVICRTLLPLTFATKMPSGVPLASLRTKTICLPSGE